MKKGMYDTHGNVVFTDTQVAALRMVIASLALAPFAFKKASVFLNTKTLLSIAVVGLLGNFVPAFLFTYAETGLSSGFTGMLNSFTPVFTVLIGALVFRVKLTPKQQLGMCIGTVGIVLLMLFGKSLSFQGGWSHIFSVVLATFCYAVSLNTIKHTLTDTPALDISSAAFLILLPFGLAGVFTTGVYDTLQFHPSAMSSLFYIGVLALFGTAISVVLFNRLIASTSALFASSVTYFIPIVAVCIGFFFGERMSYQQVGSMFVILVGVFFINASGHKPVAE
jgi:drug/metabolite transporter (DMT)-like permease